MVDYTGLLVLGAREARRSGSPTVRPRHVLAAAIRHEDGPLASRLRELSSISRSERPATPPEGSPTHLPVNQDTSRLVALAAGWALARAADEPALHDLLVAAVWGPDAPGVLETEEAGGIGVGRAAVVAELRRLDLATPATDPGPVGDVWPVFRVASERDAATLVERLELDRDASKPSWVLDGSDGLLRMHVEDPGALLQVAAELGIELQAAWADTADEKPSPTTPPV